MEYLEYARQEQIKAEKFIREKWYDKFPENICYGDPIEFFVERLKFCNEYYPKSKKTQRDIYLGSIIEKIRLKLILTIPKDLFEEVNEKLISNQ